MQMSGSYWHQLPPPYRTPLLLTSCTALIFTPFIWQKLTYQPQLLPPPPKDYPYRQWDVKDHSSSFTLPNGRTVGYAQFGDPNGKPIICLHGAFGSRLENALFDVNAKELGARIIGIERPGIGLSSPDPRPFLKRQIIDGAADVEALAVHLQLDDYAVLGTSGGGPFALACARALPSEPSKPRLRAIAVVTGLGLWDMPQSWSPFLLWLNRKLDPRWFVRWLFLSVPQYQLDLSDDERAEAMRRSMDVRKMHPADVETAKNPAYPDFVRTFLLSSRACARQGWEGGLDDIELCSNAPGFRVEDIPTGLPVQLWYGADDRVVPFQAGEETAKRLRSIGNTKVELHIEPGETHGSTQVKYQRRILTDLLRAMET
ncbi:Alpha/Beta hydrolase protein [Neohortaea acidophila]|uniref:Alpha/Beta hydrolase protein n=1 Tax=Neohortaea acidophila TaxID=245834 RepID=A0A6A6Q2C7_9PEZI|nr:Alpha/Beta hydrolase protein [Neohortaea acidophila]KAF2486106.1 Alpha/Beta hydrolase protein [Neohortaea acidophila]